MRLACQYHRKFCWNVMRNWRRWMRAPHVISFYLEHEIVPPCGDNRALEVIYGVEPT